MPVNTRERQITLAFEQCWWEAVGPTRAFIYGTCLDLVQDKGLSARVAMAAHELLENAVKYGRRTNGPVYCSLELLPWGLDLRVRNEAPPEALEGLLAAVNAVMRGDPMEMYMEQMEASLSRDASGLGLARVRCEAQADLSVSLTGDLLTVLAHFPYQN